MPETIFLAQGNSAQAQCLGENFARGEREEFEFQQITERQLKNSKNDKKLLHSIFCGSTVPDGSGTWEVGLIFSLEKMGPHFHGRGVFKMRCRVHLFTRAPREVMVAHWHLPLPVRIAANHHSDPIEG
jgi:hypothetical protein